jgi:predicted  nucleic acid-binding Zn-ribbon protein
MDRLLELQELDLSIARLDARRLDLEGGEEVRAARARATQAEDRVGELRLAIDSVDRELARLEHEADAFGRKMKAEEGRLYDGSVANPKELEAIRHELEGLRARRTRVEDEELDQMERREDLDARLKGAEAELTEIRDRLSEIQGESGRELREVQEGLVARREERAGLAAEIDEGLLQTYEDLRLSKRGVGAAALSDGICQGCHQKLSSAEIARLKQVDLKRCEYCRRILIPQ